MFTCILKKEFKSFADSNFQVEDYEKLILGELGDYYILPKNFFGYYPTSKLVKIKDNNFNPIPMDDYSFKIKLRDNQLEAFDTCLNYYKTNNKLNGFIKARCGWGKTIFSIYLAIHLKKKTIVIVDADNIKDQWIKSIDLVADVPKEKIIVLNTNTFSNPTSDDLNGSFYITTVQLLLSKLKRNREEIYNFFRDCGIDFVIYDESHAINAGENFSNTTALFCTENIIGLTATPYAKGIGEVLLYGCIGKIIYEYKDYVYDIKYNFIKYKSGLTGQNIKKLKFSKDHNIRKAVYNSLLGETDEFAELTVEYLKQHESENRVIMVIVNNIAHVEKIEQKAISQNVDVVKYYGSNKDFDKRIKNNVPIKNIIATYKKAGKAFDYKYIDTVIIATPFEGKNSLIQIIGRAVRNNDSKLDVIIYDLLDRNYLELQDYNSIDIKKSILKKEYGTKITFLEKND